MLTMQDVCVTCEITTYCDRVPWLVMRTQERAIYDAMRTLAQDDQREENGECIPMQDVRALGVVASDGRARRDAVGKSKKKPRIGERQVGVQVIVI